MCKLPEFELTQSRMARDFTISSEPRADNSWFYDRGKPGLHKFFIHCFLPAGRSEQKKLRAIGELGKDRSTYFDR